MTLRAVSHLGEEANRLFRGWIDEVRAAGVAVEHVDDPDTELDADIVFACGLLTALKIRSGTPLAVLARPIFPGESHPVYRSMLITRGSEGESIMQKQGMRLGVNEYDSWSGWHGFREHMADHNLDQALTTNLVITGSHSESIDAVLDGDCDLASIDMTVWNGRLHADTHLQHLCVVDSTRDWPSPPISLRRTLPSTTCARVVDALEGVNALHPAHADDYQFMRDQYDLA